MKPLAFDPLEEGICWTLVVGPLPLPHTFFHNRDVFENGDAPRSANNVFLCGQTDKFTYLDQISDSRDTALLKVPC